MKKIEIETEDLSSYTFKTIYEIPSKKCSNLTLEKFVTEFSKSLSLKKSNPIIFNEIMNSKGYIYPNKTFYQIFFQVEKMGDKDKDVDKEKINWFIDHNIPIKVEYQLHEDKISGLKNRLYLSKEVENLEKKRKVLEKNYEKSSKMNKLKSIENQKLNRKMKNLKQNNVKNMKKIEKKFLEEFGSKEVEIDKQMRSIRDYEISLGKIFEDSESKRNKEVEGLVIENGIFKKKIFDLEKEVEGLVIENGIFKKTIFDLENEVKNSNERVEGLVIEFKKNIFDLENEVKILSEKLEEKNTIEKRMDNLEMKMKKMRNEK